MEKEKIDIEYEERRIAEELEDIAISTEDGKVEFTYIDHSRRAKRFDRISDGNTTKYANVALEYFGNRCALSGEKFETFEVDDLSYKTNLSSEHVVALALGGHDIAPNIVPSVLQYNVRKNGYYILDYWTKQKDNNGKQIYSPYRLLKVVNYMLKSIGARKTLDAANIEKYRQAILTPNAIDNLLSQIEEQDLRETDNSKRKILSSTITTTTLDEENKKILAVAPSVDRDIPDQCEQAEKQHEYTEMLESFISDSIGIIGRELLEQHITREDGTKVLLSQELQTMFEIAVDTIPLEVQIRKTIINVLEQQGTDNVYTLTNSYIYNTDILEKTRELSEEQRQEYITNQISTKIQELEGLLTKEEIAKYMTLIPNALYDEGIIDRLKLCKKLGIITQGVDIRNVDSAIKIVSGYDFGGTVGRRLTEQEQKLLIESLLRSSSLKRHGLISTLIKKLQEKGMDKKEAYGATINYALGNNTSNYKDALNNANTFKTKEKSDIKVEVTLDAINQMMLVRGIQLEENELILKQLGVIAQDIDVRNVDSAIKIVSGYDFEGTIGRKLTEQEQKLLIEALIRSRQLNTKNSYYISTLMKKLEEKGMNQKEVYGAVINYALGNNTISYSEALGGVVVFQTQEKSDIKTEVTQDIMNQMILEKDINLEKNELILKRLGVIAQDIDVRNVDSAIKIVSGYDFEGTIGRKLTEQEQKLLIESLIGNSKLRENNTSQISTLIKKLEEKGMNQQEAYGAAINCALGNNNVSYSDALQNMVVFKTKKKSDIKTEVTQDTINQMTLEKYINLEENELTLKRLGVIAQDIDVRNVDNAIKIVSGYDFEGTVGRKLIEQEQKLLIEALLRTRLLSAKNSYYISTLIKNLEEKGMSREEAYGAVINYALGNNTISYSGALQSVSAFQTQEKNDIKVEVTQDTINQMMLEQGVQLKENEIKLKQLGIITQSIAVRNVDSAIKIVSGYDFEGTVGRRLTEQEEKLLIESLIGNSALRENGTGYISTLIKKLEEKGMSQQEAYGAVINYALGNNGSYKEALGNTGTFKTKKKSDIKTKITEESITKAVIKQQKKAAKLAKSAVTKETITQIDETLVAIDEMVAIREQQKTIE